jgi:hypothetical protein
MIGSQYLGDWGSEKSYIRNFYFVENLICNQMIAYMFYRRIMDVYRKVLQKWNTIIIIKQME